MGRYAEGTEVSVDRSQTEIKQILLRYGAQKFLLYEELDHAVVMYGAEQEAQNGDA